jgi:hypothetical protein
MTTSYRDDPYLSAVFAEWESMSDQFAQHMEKLEQVINRSEPSHEVSMAALAHMIELDRLFRKTYLLHEKFRVAETNAAPAHSRAAAP